jgi:hypothetical protein
MDAFDEIVAREELVRLDDDDVDAIHAVERLGTQDCHVAGRPRSHALRDVGEAAVPRRLGKTAEEWGRRSLELVSVRDAHEKAPDGGIPGFVDVPFDGSLGERNRPAARLDRIETLRFALLEPLVLQIVPRSASSTLAPELDRLENEIDQWPEWTRTDGLDQGADAADADVDGRLAEISLEILAEVRGLLDPGEKCRQIEAETRGFVLTAGEDRPRPGSHGVGGDLDALAQDRLDVAGMLEGIVRKGDVLEAAVDLQPFDQTNQLVGRSLVGSIADDESAELTVEMIEGDAVEPLERRLEFVGEELEDLPLEVAEFDVDATVLPNVDAAVAVTEEIRRQSPPGSPVGRLSDALQPCHGGSVEAVDTWRRCRATNVDTDATDPTGGLLHVHSLPPVVSRFVCERGLRMIRAETNRTC